MEIFLLLVVIVFILFMHFTRKVGHSEHIEEYINSLGGTLVNYETSNFFKGLGPFHTVGKSRTVYKIHYMIDGEIKEGWVRFGGFGGPDWRF